MRGVIIEAFRYIGLAGSYVFDTLKAAAGAVAFALGGVIMGLGKILQLVSGGQLGNGVDAFGQRVTDWGVKAMSSWGQSAGKVDKFFDKFYQKQTEKAKEAAKVISEEVQKAVQPAYQAVGAIVKGSKEAASVQFRQEYYARMGKDMAEENVLKNQLSEAKKQTAKLDKIEANTAKDKAEI